MATLAVVVIGLLVMVTALGGFGLARLSRRAAQLRVARVQAEQAAQLAVAATAQWFEVTERGSLVAPPVLDDLDRDQRAVDPDRDGVGVLWTRSAAPWNVRYREHGEDPWRPPQARGADDSFAGTSAGPDLCLTRNGAGAGRLAALANVIDSTGAVTLQRICWFAPQANLERAAFATVEAVAEVRVAGAAFPALAVARAELAWLEAARYDRPLVVESDATLRGAFAWRRGEAAVGGTLSVAPETIDAWPGGIPWRAADAALHDDEDADGSADDFDRNGLPDLEEWRSSPGTVIDPWWRARIGGGLVGAPAVSGPCVAPWPFGPHRSPPEAPSKRLERSGVFVNCVTTDTLRAIPAAWRDAVHSKLRGVLSYEEDIDRLGCFRLDGLGECAALDELLPAAGGLVLVRAAPTRTDPLTLTLRGSRGAIMIEGADLIVRSAGHRSVRDQSPGDPRETHGVERAASRRDDLAPLAPLDSRCQSWSVGPWVTWGAASDPRDRFECGSSDRDHEGLIATDRELLLEGPLELAGQVRARTLVGSADPEPIEVWAGPALVGDPAFRFGPPGMPRVLVLDRRIAH